MRSGESRESVVKYLVATNLVGSASEALSLLDDVCPTVALRLANLLRSVLAVLLPIFGVLLIWACLTALMVIIFPPSAAMAPFAVAYAMYLVMKDRF